MIRPRGVVMRWEYPADSVPVLFFRTREPDLLIGDEWGWSKDRSEAWVFEHFNAQGGTAENDAEEHVRKLKADGVENVFPAVAGDWAVPAFRMRVEPTPLADPAEVYQKTAVRMGEREELE